MKNVLSAKLRKKLNPPAKRCLLKFNEPNKWLYGSELGVLSS